MDGNWKRPIAEEKIANLAADIDRQGFGILANYFSEADLEPLRKLATDAGQDPTGKYADLQASNTLAGTVLEELPASPQFTSLCQRLYSRGTGLQSSDTTFYRVFRCLTGSVGQKNSYLFHYDSYVLTALIPILIPEGPERGDLLLFPNTRPIRRSYLRSLLDKLIVDNPLSHKFLKAAATRRKMGSVALPMQPGNVYFFWGYRSIHANEPCDPAKLRATALLHFGDPYRGSKFRAMIRSARGLEAA